MNLRRVHSQHAHGRRWCDAFAEGLARHSGKEGCADLLVCWGVRAVAEIEQQKARGGEVCILECGYVGERTVWTSVSLGGGLNGRGRFGPPGDDGARFDANFGGALKPWKSSEGEYALICGQVSGDMSVLGVNLDDFYADAARICEQMGVKPLFRPHPLGECDAPEGVDVQMGTLAEGLARASFAVTWNSNSGVDAALAGVPVVAMDRGSMAWDVAAHEVCRPPRRDRRKWAAHLAWKQWTFAEIASGEAWAHLKTVLN